MCVDALPLVNVLHQELDLLAGQGPDARGVEDVLGARVDEGTVGLGHVRRPGAIRLRAAQRTGAARHDRVDGHRLGRAAASSRR